LQIDRLAKEVYTLRANFAIPLNTPFSDMKRSYTVLYVDDDQDDLFLLAEAFEQYTDNLIVAHAYNGFEGLQVLEKMNREGSLPCLIILDINMPIMDGKATLAKIKTEEAYKDIPVVMFSTSQNPSDIAFAENLGAEYFVKPISYNNIKELVADFVKRCNLQIARA
jgi:CheY-like chemotaxis protein